MVDLCKSESLVNVPLYVYSCSSYLLDDLSRSQRKTAVVGSHSCVVLDRQYYSFMGIGGTILLKQLPTVFKK